MRYRNKAADRMDSSFRRRGQIVWVLMIVLVITFLLGILVINSHFVVATRIQHENGTDAAAIAAAEVLADEALLYASPSIFSLNNHRSQASEIDSPASTQSLLGRATSAGIAFGQKNFVCGRRLEIRPADVFFDIVDVSERHIKGTLPADADPRSDIYPPLTLAQKRSLNSVQVVGKSIEERENTLRLPFRAFFSRQMISRSEAVLDGNICGFHTDPVGAINIPMAPLALGVANWSEQVEKRVDPSFATPTDGPLPYGDFTVLIGANPRDPDSRDPRAYSPILLIGTSTVAEAAAQFNPVNPGITPAQYGNYLVSSKQKTLALDAKTLLLSIPGSPRLNDLDLTRLEGNLLKLTGKRLIWPLYSGYEDQSPAGKVIISGFVAARVTKVNRVTYSILVDRHGKVVPNSKFKGDCGKGKWHRDGKEDSSDSSGRPDGEKEDQQDFSRRPRGGENDGEPGQNSREQGGGSCLEFTVLQLTLRPTLLATSTGIVAVKDFPTGPQHQFRFPNAYVKRIRLMN